MRFRRLLPWFLAGLVVIALAYAAQPYARALSLIVRAADMGGAVEAFANDHAREVTVEPDTTIPTRHGRVPARFYRPAGRYRRAALLVPGIHAMGIDEPRLTGLARDLAGTGVGVMTMALPDLMRYSITPRATDQIEDAIVAVAAQPSLAPDGRVGVIGISFAGGLSVAAAGRPSVRGRAAYVLSFGGHGDLARVVRYLCTGEAPRVDGVAIHPPHDYGVAVVLFGMAHLLVPPEQVEPLREGIRTFLWASQLTLVDQAKADATFASAREMADALAEPAATYLKHVNDRNVAALGPVLVPHADMLAGDEAVSPEHAPAAPSAPVYLLHGAGDTVIPPVESVLLGRHLEARGASARVLLSGLITHAEVNRSAAAAETWNLMAFWADVLAR